MRLGHPAVCRLLIEHVTAQAESSSSLADVLRVVARVLMEESRWVWGEVWLAHASRTPMRCHEVFCREAQALMSLKAASLQMLVREGEGLPGRCLQQSAPLWIEALALEPAFLRGHLINAANLTRGVFIPFRDGDRVLGVVGLMDGRLEAAQAEEEAAWRALVDMAHGPLERLLARRQQQIELAHLFDLSTDLMCVLGIDGLFKRINPAFMRVLGWSRERLLSQALLALLHPDDLGRAQGWLASLEPAQSPLEARFACADGSWRWLSWTGSAVRDEALLYLVARDVTERKAAEIRIHQQAERLDQTSDAVLVEDLQGVVRYWNRSAARLLGLNPPKPPCHADALFSVDPVTRQAAYDATRQHGAWAGEMTLCLANGKTLLTDARWTLVCDDAQRPLEILTVYSDITERKQLEALYLRAQRLESIGTLAGGIAHDVNNVLAPILMATTMLRMVLADMMPHIPEDIEDLIAMIESCTNRGTQTVQRVLSFARGTPSQHVALRPSEVLQDLAQILGEALPRAITLRVLPSQALPSINGDPTQLQQILLNLAINARDAMPSGGVLTLSAVLADIDARAAAPHTTAQPGLHVVFRVNDTGPGIPPDVYAHLFEPFFTTKPLGQGTGLGLATALSLARAHSGFILAHTEPGGATFELYIPAISQ